jgi:hypothetical protein
MRNFAFSNDKSGARHFFKADFPPATPLWALGFQCKGVLAELVIELSYYLLLCLVDPLPIRAA